MMTFEDYINWRNRSMQHFWKWYTYTGVYKGLSKANARASLTAVIERELEIQEYED